MSIFDHALHIPAERLFFESSQRHERVLLPLAARPSWRFVAALGLAAFAALACVGMGIDVLATGDRGGGALIFGPVFLAAAVLPAIVAITGVRDFTRGQPFLVIDQQGITDRRFDETMVWEEIVTAELMASGSGINAVRLTFDRDRVPRFNPCRIGGWSADWPQRRRTRTIALMLLDRRAHTLAHTMLVLAARHGASIEQPSPFTIGSSV